MFFVEEKEGKGMVELMVASLEGTPSTLALDDVELIKDSIVVSILQLLTLLVKEWI